MKILLSILCVGFALSLCGCHENVANAMNVAKVVCKCCGEKCDCKPCKCKCK